MKTWEFALWLSLGVYAYVLLPDEAGFAVATSLVVVYRALAH